MDHGDPPKELPQKIGLIAGNGRFPFLVLEEARQRGISVVTLAIKEEAEPAVEEIAGAVHWVGLGELSRAVRILKEAGIDRVIMAGQVKHKRVFNILRPDKLLIKVLSRLRSRSTDTILKAVADVLSEEGVELIDSTLLLTSVLSTEGPMGKRRPSTEEKDNLAFGYRMAKALARLDIGQTVVVKEKSVVAVEAMEGTDETVRRAGRIVSESPGGLAVVKVARPSQDMRFDVPVVGPRTIEVMSEAGVSVLALEPGKCLLLEKDTLLKRADELKIAVYGITKSEMGEA
jgi:DUF1009 family protein